jgi:hypothetical protein
MKKPKKKKLKSKNFLLGTIIVFLLFITWYIAKTQANTAGHNTVTGIIQEQVPENQGNTAPAADTSAQNGRPGAVPSDSSGQAKPVFAGDAAADRHGWGLTRNKDHLQPGIPSMDLTGSAARIKKWFTSPLMKAMRMGTRPPYWIP